MFEGLKLLWEEYLDYHGQKQYVKRGATAKNDLETLKTWLSTTVVPFKGFAGKIYFAKTTEFPRYKFADYSRNNNQIVRRVRDIDNSDAVVIDTTEYIDVIKTGLRNLNNWSLVELDYNGTGQSSYVNSTLALGQDYYRPYSEHNQDYKQLEFLTWLYSNFLKKNFKIINVQDLSQNLGKQYEAINVTKAEQLARLFDSKSMDDVKLAMEVMTNCDLEASYFHSALLFGKYGRNEMRVNNYWNSTSFRTFRNAFDGLGLNCESLWGQTPLRVTESYLKLPNKFIFEEDIEYVKKLVTEFVEENYKFETVGFKLNNYDIELNVDPSKVIKSTVIDAVSEPELVESGEVAAESSLQ